MRLRTALVLSAAAASAAVAAAAAGCAKRVDQRPSIEILTPTDGNSTGASTFPVLVKIRNFTLTLTTEGGNTPFLGHWELFRTEPADNPQGFISLGRQFTTSALISAPAGSYILDAELENIDDEPVLGAPPSYIVVSVPSTPSVVVTSPADGASIPSSSVDLGIQVENFTLDSSGGPNVPGEGHYHVYAGAGVSGPLLLSDWRPTATVTRLDEAFPGTTTETLTVALVNADDTLVSPTTTATISLQRPAGSPGIHLIAPTDGPVLASFPITVETTNFTLVDWTTAVADSAGQGHYQVLVDGAVVGESFSTTTGATIAPGSHEVRVQLVGNLHDALSPPVVDRAGVTSP